MKNEQLPSGHIELLLLSIVNRQPIHAYAIIQHLKQRSSGSFDLPEGTVYPALYRLERTGLLKSKVMTVDSRRRRMYYVTPAGRVAMGERKRLWERLVVGMTAVLRGD